MERVVVEVPINNGFSLAGPSTTPRKRQVRFSARHDIILLREVIVQNPFASKEPGRMWARVGEIITAALQDENFEVDARRCRERTMLLLDYYKKQDFPSLRRFGTERLYAQKEDLLHEVLELEAEKGLLASGENTKYQDDELRKRAIEELSLPEQDKPNITITQTPTAAEPEEDREEIAQLSAAPMAKQPCQCCCQTYSEILSFLEKRSEAEQRLREEELALRREELEIQRSKIALERERLGAERKERERRFELESQERQVILDLLKEKLSYGYKKMNRSRSGYLVFSANSTTACTELAKKITERLGVELGKSLVHQEPNTETRVDVKESVRGQDIFIIQTIPREVNTAIMELLVMAYALKTSCAKNIIGVIPYFPYSKQCKMRKRGSIVCKLLASMLTKAGLTHIITMDLHQKEIQGFFSFPVDNLRASPFLIQYIQDEIPDYRNAVIVAKSPSAAKRAQSYAERLRLGLAVMHGEAHHSELDMADGRHSPPLSHTTTGHTGLELPSNEGRRHVSSFPGMELPMMMAKEKPPITVVGDVGGRIAIIVDDIIDDVEDFVAAAEILKERGAYKIYIMATHGLLSADAPRLIEESAIDEVVVTNTVPHEVQKLQCPKIKTVDVSMILAEAIRRIHNGESMAYLFRNIALED